MVYLKTVMHHSRSLFEHVIATETTVISSSLVFSRAGDLRRKLIVIDES